MTPDQAAIDPIVPEAGASPRTPAWARHLTTALSLIVLGAVIWQLTHIDFAEMWRLMPTSPLFWLLFIASYMTGVGFDWILFRRLWNLPPSGIIILLRKAVANQILLDYAGEAYLYAWAKRNTGVTPAPFAAIKDVTLLSGLAGNFASVVLLALCWPYLHVLDLGSQVDGFVLSIIAVLAISLGVIVFRGRVFSLPGCELRFIMAVHIIRIAVQLILTALLWLVLLPGTSAVWLLLLSTLRQLISRLPLLANKDLPFAAAVVVLIGSQNNLTNAIALTAALSMGAHIVVGLALAVGGAWGTFAQFRRR